MADGDAPEGRTTVDSGPLQAETADDGRAPRPGGDGAAAGEGDAETGDLVDADEALPDEPEAPEHLRLAEGFPPVDRDTWRRDLLGLLRKAGRADEDTRPEEVEELLATTTYDGLRIAPLYAARDAPPIPPVPGLAPFVRGTGPTGGEGAFGAWDVRQRHGGPDAEEVADAVVADLEGGVTSLWLEVGGDGLPVAGLERVLRDVFVDLAPVVLDAGPAAEAAADAFLTVARDKGVDLAELPGGLGADPLGCTARTGTTPDLDVVVRLVRRCADEAPRVRAVTVDALPYATAGGSDAQELACATATGIAYLRALIEADVPLKTALGALEFRLSVSDDQFLALAKLRAGRRVWARVAEACGAPEEHRAQRQHAVTSPLVLSRRDPWVNMLRTTVACFAAGVGGAHAVTVLPFDSRVGRPDAFARRVARNTQVILQEESSLGRVLDPAGGSWYVESLTEDLARAAWAELQEIERGGGMAEALASGVVAERLAGTWERRAVDVAHRRAPVTGVSEFPHLDEPPLERAPLPAPPSGGLPVHALGEAFEALRDRADEAAADGDRPAVFLATVGPQAAHGARATFAANLFAAGGLATPRSGPSTDPDEIAAAFRASGTTVACLCSSDRLYGEHAEAVARALADAGATRVLLAGRPRDLDPVDGYVFAGCDALAALHDVHADLGLSPDRTSDDRQQGTEVPA